MAKSMEQRVKEGPLRARWKAAQSKNKALDDRKFAELGKLLDSYDDSVGEYEAGAGDDDDAVGATFDKVNSAMTAFMNKNQQLHKSLSTLEADFGKGLAELTRKRADRVNMYSILLAQLADKRRVVFSDFVANDKATSDKVLDIVGEFAQNAQATAKLQGDVAGKCEKLAGQIRSVLQNYKRQVSEMKDKNAAAALDDLLGLL
jgi:uncharacterized protein YukE